MPQSFADLRLEEAWLPFEPSSDRPFDRRLAAHLYRRAGFAANTRELDEAVRLGPQQTVKRLLTAGEASAPFDAEMSRFAQTTLAANNPELLSSWWLHRMRHTPAPLVEKMTLFWHGHFATSAAKVRKGQLMLAQNELLRRHALGSFAELARGIARDPAMLLYLDSATNRKNHPNENFAREVMELFCLGLGKYTERDIQELARCFTGWEIQQDAFKFYSYQHDYGTKTVLGKSGPFDGDDGLAVILDQPATAEFVCGKLVRFFITEDEELPPAWIAPLAQRFRDEQLKAAPVLEMMLTSRLFYSSAAVGRKVRSPVELGVGLLRSLDSTTNMVQLAQSLRELGQMVLFPPNVKGWGGGKHWIDSSTLLARANLVRRLAAGAQPAGLQRLLIGKSSGEAVGLLAELLLAAAPPADVRAQLIDQLDGIGGNRTRLIQPLVVALGSLPEFQLS